MTSRSPAIENPSRNLEQKWGSGYPFLVNAERHLSQQPDDHYARLLTIREFLRLGLILPAREHVERALLVGEPPVEFGELKRSLATVRVGLVPWAEGEVRFHANLSALASRGVDAGAIECDWQANRNEFQWLRSSRGDCLIRRRSSRGDWEWFPGLADHAAVAAAHPEPEGIGSNMPGPYVFDGLGLGHFFERVYAATLDTFLGFSCALIVVEPSPAALAVVLHLHDWRTLLADKRIFWLLGEGWPAALDDLWDRDVDLPWPRQAFSVGWAAEPSGGRVVEIIRSAAGRRECQVRDSFQEVEGIYAGSDAAHWALRFEEALDGRGEPLRVLAAVSTHTTFLQYAMRDAQRALENLGHSCVVLTESAPYQVLSPLTFHAAIRRLRPDVFLAIDHLRPEFGHIIPANLPILTWDQDQLPHVFTLDNMRRVARHDFLVGCSKSKWVQAGCLPQQFLHARLPTCPEQFSGEPLSAEEIGKYACDVSYVSHASQTAQAFHQEQRAACSDERLAVFLDALFELMPEALDQFHVAGRELCDALLARASRHCGFAVCDPELIGWLRSWYLWRLGDRMFRHQALEWVGEWAQSRGRVFRIYGNGWERHPTLSRFAAGPAQNGRELVCIHRASRINLQLMPAGFIHQRALDGLAAGGFFMTRWVPEDFRGRWLRSLVGLLDECRIRNQIEVFASQDPRIKQAWIERFGELSWGQTETDLYQQAMLSAELEYPDEVFPDFERIAFDSKESFGERADDFLGDPNLREKIAGSMRAVVVERFSYRAAISHYLSAMSAFLRWQADNR